jgi:hypothetical protein
MTLTLWELRQLSGLPVYGSPYEEFSPRDLDSPRRPDSLRRVFRVYEDLRKKKGVSFEQWIRYFVDFSRVTRPSTDEIYDPLGTGRGEIDCRVLCPPSVSIARPGIDEETFFTALLRTWWLCHFVVPCRPGGMIRPEIFVVASDLATGKRVSLRFQPIFFFWYCYLLPY